MRLASGISVKWRLATCGDRRETEAGEPRDELSDGTGECRSGGYSTRPHSSTTHKSTDHATDHTSTVHNTEYVNNGNFCGKEGK